MDNTLTLDTCRYRLEGEKWSEELLIWRAQKEIRERLGMRPVHRNGQEQRYKWVGEPHPSDGRLLEMQMSFVAEELPEGEICLALEHPEDYVIFCNGLRMDGEIKGWLLDREIKKVALKNLQRGENFITLRCSYRNDMEVEECYLCGDFGVAKGRRLTAPPRRLYTGDWTLQGLLHYPGAVRYQYCFDCVKADKRQIYLKLQDYGAVCVSVFINGSPIEVPWRSASLLNITSLLKPCGSNSLTVEVTGSPRNLFGPFHLNDRKRDVTNDACFHPEEGEATENYNTVSYGLYQPPRLYEVRL